LVGVSVFFGGGLGSFGVDVGALGRQYDSFSYLFVNTSDFGTSIPISDEPVFFRSSVLEIPMARVSFRFLFSAAVRGFLLSASTCVTAVSASTDLWLPIVRSSVLPLYSASFPVTLAVTESP